MKKILIIVGARPNFIKVTQFKKLAGERTDLEIKIAHTGQHYDRNLSQVFFQELELVPDYFLNIDNSSPNTQIGEILIKLEKLVKNDFAPDLMIVVGDVNSTFAAALAANKMGIKIAHLEAGLRSGDRNMPEEINRILTDEISDYCLVTEQSGLDNLLAEKKPGKTWLVGNTMIDTIVAFEHKIQGSTVQERLKIAGEPFILMTIHRPSTVDHPERLALLLDLIKQLSGHYKIVFPAHPRTIKNAKKHNLYEELCAIDSLIMTDPLPYFDFQKLIASCSLVLTDSGGIQEETTFRQVPCLTLRANTERPSTITLGTNELVKLNPESILQKVAQIEQGTYKTGQIPPLWDGKATERILDLLSQMDL